MGHDHSHHHHHHPTPEEADQLSGVFAWSVGLNLLLVAVQAWAGWRYGSLALLSDSGHNAGDVVGLLLAWGAWRVSHWRPSGRFTYGMKGASVFAPLVQSCLILFAMGMIAWESIERLSDQSGPRLDSTMVMAFAGLGILINGGSALLFLKRQGDDLNLRGAYLHLMADAWVSGGVLVSAGLIGLTGWLWIDPVVSLVVCAWVLKSTWGLLADSTSLALHAAPSGIIPHEVENALLQIEGVCEVHDLHIWNVGSAHTVLTCHLLIDTKSLSPEAILQQATHVVQEEYDIDQSTIQIETDQGQSDVGLKRKR
jgi:cobalt-zinc-cadmium efflux system protein